MNLGLKQNELSYIFKNMDDAVCITSRNGVIRYINKSAKRLLGIEDSAENQKIWNAIPYVERNDALIQLFIDAITAKEKSFQDFVEFEKNDGSVCHLRVSLTYSNEDDEEMFVIVINNLTEFMRVSSAFRRYTSSSIADYVLNTPGGEMIGGVAKDVTILMSDLRGFTALSTRLAPTDLITILNHYFESMVKVIEKYNGTVIEFLGDGIFVVFGAPKDDPNHAVDAVSCAIEMENMMAEVNAWNEENNYPTLEMGIGINSGTVIVGNIGSDEKMKYGCMGEPVNIAGRVETFTIGGQVIISENTKALIKEKLEIAGEQSFLPKGAKDEMKIYEISGIGDVSLNSNDEVIEWLPEAGIKVSFYELDGKYVGDVAYEGRVLSLSKNERYAKLVADTELKKSQNITIDISENLYAKVVDVCDEFYTICFTSKPDSYADWSKALK